MNKKHTKLKMFGIIIAVIAIFLTVINMIPPSKAVENNPFLKKEGEKTMLAAHRGGAITNPENTMKAFKAAVNKYNVDIIESDLYLTKDNYLVYNHDEYIDETCDTYPNLSLQEVKKLISDDPSKAHYIKDMTLDELRYYNYGYYFEDKYTSERLYRDIITNSAQNRVEILEENDLQIVEVSELFEEFYHQNKDLLFIVEIKNSGEDGYKAVDILMNVLNNYPEYKKQIVIGTFHPEIEDYLKTTYPDVLRGASTKGASTFVITEMLKINLFDTNNFSCLQIPIYYNIKGINIYLNKKMYIKRAHRRNIAVQYWTINNEEEMKQLIALNCDAIMSDDLELCRKTIDNYS